MPHELAQEHCGIYDAFRAGTARNQATIQAALTAIGATPTILPLPFAGDGIWALSSNLTMPTNVILMPAPGVTVNVPTGVTFGVGLVIAANNTWKTGPGTLNKSAVATPMEISNLVCTTYVQSNSIGGVTWELNDAPSSSAKVQMFVNQGATCGITLSRNISVTNSTWNLYTQNSGDLLIARPGGTPQVFINNTGVMLGSNTSPSFMLQLGTGDAAKPAGTTWNVTSDARLKDVQGTFEDGLAKLLALPPPVRFTFNGKAGIPADGKEYVSMLAQDVQPVAPYMVGSYQAKLEPDDAELTELLTLDTSPMIFAVVNALRELDTRLQALEALPGGRLQALEQVAHRHGGSGNAGVVQPYTPPSATQAETAPIERERPDPPAPRSHRRRH